MKREELLVNCLEDIQDGKHSLEECTALYPDFKDELQALVSILSKINDDSVAPSPEFVQRAKNHLMAVMESTEAERRQKSNGLRRLLVSKLNYALTAASLLLVIGSGSAVYASQQSLPGDALYPVKTGVEMLQSALALTPESKVNLHIRLAERRIQEVLTESTLQRDVSLSALEAIPRQIDSAVRDMTKISANEVKPLLSQLSQATLSQQASLEQIAGVAPAAVQAALKQAIDTTRRGSLIAEIANGNPSFLGTGASVLDDKLESTYFQVEGTLLDVEGRTWNLGGIHLDNMNVSGKVPDIGSGLKLRGMVRNNEIFIHKIERQETELPETKIKGIFGGTDAGGTTWYVGGVPVKELNNFPSPSMENQLEVRGTPQNGTFKAHETEDNPDKKQDRPKNSTANSGDSKDKSGSDTSSDSKDDKSRSDSKTSSDSKDDGSRNSGNTSGDSKDDGSRNSGKTSGDSKDDKSRSDSKTSSDSKDDRSRSGSNTPSDND